MKLNLKCPATLENASRLAELMVEAAFSNSGVNLDFSISSLNRVDRIIEDMRRGGVELEQVAETLFGFGCYVGEVKVISWLPPASAETPW